MIASEGYGEIVGGGQREESLEVLIDRIRHHDLPLEPFKWYLDLRKYGSVEEIIDDFYDVRLGTYSKRKKQMIIDLEKLLVKYLMIQMLHL